MEIVHNFRIPQFLPSLVDIAASRLAIHFFNDSVDDFKTLERIFIGIQQGMTVTFNEESQKDRKAKRLHDKFLLIPRHLRLEVFHSVLGLHFNYSRWYMENIPDQFKPYFKCFSVSLRSDGSFDRIKIARYYVMNENVNIRLRFYFACVYCIEESVLSLWKEMEACGETINFDTTNNLMTNFWVKWMQEGSRVPWVQALKEYFTNTHNLTEEDCLLIRPFFTLLQPEERGKFLTALNWAKNYDDSLFCLRAATTEEKVKILQNKPGLFLVSHLNWPLQNIFLEAAELVWHLLDAFVFILLLFLIWELHENWEDLYPSQLFKDFWHRCPIELKETVEPNSRMKIDSILKKIRKREMRLNLEANGKKWIRGADGRLKRTT